MNAHQDLVRQEVEALRHALLANGYQPVAVAGIRPGDDKTGKKPVQPNWPNLSGMPAWSPNTGINCRGLRPIDVDVDERTKASGILELIEKRLGPAPTRIRSNSGRCLSLYRAAEGAPKKRVLDLGDGAKVEVLGAGQQFVAFGKHWTDVELQWENGSPLDTPGDKLTTVTEEQIEAVLDEIFERFATPTAKAARTGKGVEAARAAEKLERSISDAGRASPEDEREAGRAALDALPNDYGYDDWIKIGMSAFVTGVSSEDWDRWSQRHRSYDLRNTLKAWRSFEKGGVREVTERTLFKEVRERVPGWKKPGQGRGHASMRAAPPPPAKDEKPGGNGRALNAHALQHLDAWVPGLGQVERREDGSYVVTADATGEVLAEPMTISPTSTDALAFYANLVGMPREDAERDLADQLGFALKLDENAGLRAARAAKRAREAEMASVYAEGRDGLPTIRYHARAFTSTAEQSERAIMHKGADVYVRGDALVRPVVVEARGATGKSTKVAELTRITLPYMRKLMDRAAVYMQPGPRNGPTWVPSPPPKEVAELILDQEGDWPFTGIVGVIAAPTLRPDGSLLDKPGYDPATQLYLVPGVALPPIPEQPTREDALAALGRLDALLREFPFEDDVSRSVALSGLITPIVRGMLAHAPIHCFTAPAAGTGKSYLVDTASAIATGFTAEALAVAKKEEETEKRFDGALLAGAPLLNIDNVNGRFSSEKLCQIATAERVVVRALGTSKLDKVETKTTVFLNGNNLGLSIELARRSLMARLDARMEKPHERQFKGDPVAEVMADRGRYVADALIIILAYMAAGRPSRLPRIASFNDWSDNVRSALVWLGRADPAATLDKARDDSPELANVVAVSEAWERVFGLNVEVTAAQVIARAGSAYDASQDDHQGALREALLAVAGSRGEIDPTRFGNWLRDNSGIVVKGRRLERSKTLSAGKPRWSWKEV